VVGFKPSFDRIPFDGAVLLSESLDTVGFLTQDVESMRLAASVLIDGWQDVTVEQDRLPVLGVPTGKMMGYMYPETLTVFEEQVKRLEEAGYTVKRVDLPCEEEIDFLYDEVFRLLRAEMVRNHRELFAQHEALYRPHSLDGIRKGELVTDEVLNRARAGQIALREAFAETMSEQGIDLFVCPSQPRTAPEITGSTGFGGQTSLWSYAGMPCVSVPAGADESGLPYGFQCVGAFGQDEWVLAYAERIGDVVGELADKESNHALFDRNA
jgi:Asp-tRNA(Asn)/Glu-tRNA(Gln) amidotransferase A subunit family amidase